MKDTKVNDRIARLLGELSPRGGRIQAAQRLFEAVLAAGYTWDELLLVLSNLCVAQRDRLQRGRKVWHQRALLLHQGMEKERARKLAQKGAQTP